MLKTKAPSRAINSVCCVNLIYSNLFFVRQFVDLSYHLLALSVSSENVAVAAIVRLPAAERGGERGGGAM